MRAYMAYSRSAGSSEGAILIFHHTQKQAKQMVWQSGIPWGEWEWVDLAVKWMRDESICKLGHPDLPNTPHVIWSPKCCESCGNWGCGITRDNKCCECDEYPGDELVAKLRGAKR